MTQEEIKEAVTDATANAIKQVEAEKVKASSNTTTVKLPSNGLINPNITEVTLRRMSVKESKTLYTSKDPNYLTALILSCIVEPTNITEFDLHPNDVVYLIFILRHISSPRNVVQKVMCSNPDCQKLFDAQVIVPDLKVNYATLDYNYHVDLPDAGDKIAFHILSEGDLTNCEKITDRHIRQKNLQDTLDDGEVQWEKTLAKIAYMIDTKNELEFKDFDEKVKYLESLSAYDFELFNKAYNDIISSFGLDRSFYTECPHCKEEVEVQAYIAPDFFQLV